MCNKGGTMKTLVWYCKGKKKTGTPIRVQMVLDSGTIIHDYYTNKFYHTPTIEDLVTVEFNNATGAAKRQGATTMLVIERIYNEPMMEAVIKLKKKKKIILPLEIKTTKRRRKTKERFTV